MIISSKLYDKWDKLREQSLSTDFSGAISGFYSCPFGYTYVAIDQIGNESIYLTLDKAAIDSFQKPSLNGIEFSIVSEPRISTTDKLLQISLSASYSDVREAFEAFTITLTGKLSTVSDSLDALEIIYSVCSTYSKFFSKRCQTNLSPLEEQGLFGELLVLRRVIEEKGDDAIKSWMGPDRSRHDFVFSGNKAIEVKTTLKQTTKIVTISNSVQLENTAGAPLYLMLIVLEKNPSGRKTSDLLNEVYEMLCSNQAKEEFDQKLLELAVARDNFPSANSYVLINSHCFLVDDKFPKLDPDYIHAKSTRISEVKYKIDLEGYDEITEDVYGQL